APALPCWEEPVLYGHLGAVLGEDLGGDHRRLAVHPFPGVVDLLAAVQLDLRDVRALQEVSEERHEFLALLLGASLPVPAQRATRDLVEVEDIVGDLADGGAPLPRPALTLDTIA